MPPGNHNQPHNNPYATAAGAYGSNAQKSATDPRELEARVLLKSAQFMQDLQNDWDNADSEAIEQTLKYNRNIWMMFYDTALENTDGGRPDNLRANILNLANFVFQRELDIMAKPEKAKLDILIGMNRDLAAGLLKSAQSNPAAASASGPNSAAQSSDTQPQPEDPTDHSA